MAGIPDSEPREEEILWVIEATHLDEAEFLFEVWEAALDAPNYTLAELAAGPEQRLLAHVDALSIGGPVVAERLLLPTISDSEAWFERVAAASLAFYDDRGRSDRVVSILLEAEGEQRRGLMRALELVGDPGLDARLVQALGSHGRGHAAVLELLARRRAPVGDWIVHWLSWSPAREAGLSRDDLTIARAAARLVRRVPDPRALDGLAPLAQSSDATLRHAALETALCRQVAGAWESAVYWAFVAGDSPFRREALTWVAMLGDAGAQQRLLALVDSAEHRADALWALGFGGRIAAVDRCIELLADEQLGPLAAELICAITGLPGDDDTFWVDPPEEDDDEHSQELPELHEDLDRDLLPDAEAALPVPEPQAIARWWHAQRNGFDAGLRYLYGQPWTGQSLLDALGSASMRRRHALALELELRTGGGVALDTRRFGFEQRSQLEAIVAIELPNFQRGLPLGG